MRTGIATTRYVSFLLTQITFASLIDIQLILCHFELVRLGNHMTELFPRNKALRGIARHAAPKPSSKIARGALHTLPILLVGSMAISLGATAPIDLSSLKRDNKPKDSDEQLRGAVADAMSSRLSSSTSGSLTPAAPALALASTAPSTYRVVSGDTVSGIAARYGLATATVLSLNGLGWKSLIFPGQILVLTNTASAAPVVTPPAATPSVATPPVVAPPTAPAPAPTPPVSATTAAYSIVRGDTISAIAQRFGVSTQSVLSANQLGWSTIIYPGQRIVIPQAATAISPPPAAVSPPPAPATTAPPAAETAPPVPPVIEITPVVTVTPIANLPHNATYVIVSGDTVTSIAARFGVSVQSILDANGLNRSSIIYAGRSLVIPGPSTAPAGVSGAVTPLSDEMAVNARTIISVGTSLGVSDYGLVIALAAAMQESSLRNLNYGDRDSLGLFQQRPSTGWGSPAQVTDPVYASRLFFGGPSNPNRGNTRGLLDIPGWQSMTVTHAAQSVQLSAYPDAYAKWETSARTWLSQLR